MVRDDVEKQSTSVLCFAFYQNGSILIKTDKYWWNYRSRDSNGLILVKNEEPSSRVVNTHMLHSTLRIYYFEIKIRLMTHEFCCDLRWILRSEWVQNPPAGFWTHRCTPHLTEWIWGSGSVQNTQSAFWTHRYTPHVSNCIYKI